MSTGALSKFFLLLSSLAECDCRKQSTISSSSSVSWAEFRSTGFCHRMVGCEQGQGVLPEIAAVAVGPRAQAGGSGPVPYQSVEPGGGSERVIYEHDEGLVCSADN